MTPSFRTRAAAVAALAALASFVPAASGEDAKPAGGPAVPAKPEVSPADLYAARRPEILGQVAARLESTANAAWGFDLKLTAVEMYRRVLEFDAESKKAREQLGFEKKEGAWTPNEAKQKKIADYEDSSKGEKKRGEYEKKLRDAEVAAAKLLADLGELANKAGEEDAAKGFWRQALDFDDQNSLANDRRGNKKVDGKWFTARALAHKEFDKVYKASLKKAQDLGVAVVSCDDTTGISEAAGFKDFRRYKSKNFRIESNLPDGDIRETLTWMERARVFFLEIYQVPERLLAYEADPMVFVIAKTVEQKDKLIDACGGIPEKEKSFKKKFTSVAVGGKLTLCFEPTGEAAQRTCTHTATHSFVRDSFGQHAPWLTEALANSVSAAVRKADLIVCFSGEGSTGGIHLENFSLEQAPGALRDWVKTGKDTPVSEFVKLPSDGLNALQIAKSWSIVMFLLEMDRSQAREYFAAAGQGNGGDASKDDKVLSQFFTDYSTWKRLDVDWREWALDVYKQ